MWMLVETLYSFRRWTIADYYQRYSTLDNVDGKQARRTGTSSGLGELFELVFTRQRKGVAQDINAVQSRNRLSELHHG